MVYHYINTILSWLMRAALLVSGIFLILQGDSLGLLALIAFVVTFIPTFLRAKYDIQVPWWIESLIVLGFFLDVVIGSEFAVYTNITGFDWITHLLGTFIISIIALSIVYSLKVTGNIKVSHNMIWWFVVVFALAVGAFYEIIEFVTDQILATNSQISLVNTMIDLINDFIGGIVTATWGSYYLKRLQGRKAKDILDPYIKLLKIAGFRIKERVKKFQRMPGRHG
ncbi:MAG TPA: hypothetical protein VLJ21_03065 [Candidatus Binatia bacterium]|nr:hypothetical protein [Candidatus Binatia bacterium]